MRFALLAGLLTAGTVLAFAQADSASRSILHGAAVEYMFPEQVNVAAGKPTEIALHFRIAEGLHINSHVPRDEYLIPTSFSIPDGLGVRLQDANYPDGKDLTLPSDPSTRLSVYTGEFVIHAHVIAEAGDHLVEAKLHYQACNDTQCLPPKTIPVAIDVVSK